MKARLSLVVWSHRAGLREDPPPQPSSKDLTGGMHLRSYGQCQAEEKMLLLGTDVWPSDEDAAA